MNEYVTGGTQHETIQAAILQANCGYENLRNAVFLCIHLIGNLISLFYEVSQKAGQWQMFYIVKSIQ